MRSYRRHDLGDMLSPLIRQINSIVDSDARLQARMVATSSGDEAETTGDRPRSASCSSGKADNRKELDRLSKEVNDSNGIALSDKAVLLAL